MNHTHNFINLFVRRGKDGTVTQWKISSLVILALVVLLVASLLALGVYAGISAGSGTASINEAPSISENPELKVVQRYAEWMFTEANALAVNPELKYAERYSLSTLERMNGLYGDSSPELGVHQRFVDASEQAAALALQYANPEVNIHRRWVEFNKESASAAFLAENPEIKVIRRFEEVNK